TVKLQEFGGFGFPHRFGLKWQAAVFRYEKLIWRYGAVAAFPNKAIKGTKEVLSGDRQLSCLYL
ncbi:MAG: hypothetical protein IKM73_03570, partial [Acidaminococcaceae bacterium]|nr:hypothetical protein [Acidaminococcaceae bacterium]